MLARLRNAQAIGLILLGLGASVRVLQTGDDVENVFDFAIVVAVSRLGGGIASGGLARLATSIDPSSRVARSAPRVRPHS
jgi:hypothetical protein